ncbi:hypothetical protein [Actinomyces israelii]|uniref:hypothetical protein n=1 Tax=Actinomyces israelii TaxID=1659 RepID=UPI002557A141|nr:hypothetical protein [Actinomyces israelii]
MIVNNPFSNELICKQARAVAPAPTQSREALVVGTRAARRVRPQGGITAVEVSAIAVAAARFFGETATSPENAEAAS